MTIATSNPSKPIQRGDAWWQQHPDGGWMRWSTEGSKWVSVTGSPPPPPAPPPGKTEPQGAETSLVSTVSSTVPHPGAPGTSAVPQTNWSVASSRLHRARSRRHHRYRQRIMGLSLVAVLVVGLAAYLATRSEDPSSARRQALHAQPAEAQAGLARSAFIQKAGAICIDEEARQQRLLQRAAPATLAEFAAYFDRSMPGYRKMMDALEALKPPPGDRKLVKAFFGEARRAIDSMAMMRRAAGAGDEEAFAVALNDTQRITQQANALATSYGLDSCAGID